MPLNVSSLHLIKEVLFHAGVLKGLQLEIVSACLSFKPRTFRRMKHANETQRPVLSQTSIVLDGLDLVVLESWQGCHGQDRPMPLINGRRPEVMLTVTASKVDTAREGENQSVPPAGSPP